MRLDLIAAASIDNVSTIGLRVTSSEVLRTMPVSFARAPVRAMAFASTVGARPFSVALRKPFAFDVPD